MTSVAVSAVPRRAGQRDRRRPGLRAVPAVDPSGARGREMVALRRSGLTLVEIGRRFGVSRQRVGQILETSGGAPMPQHEVSTARRAADARRARKAAGETLELWRRGERVAEIAARVGVSQQSVRDTVAALAGDADRRARGDVRRARLGGRGAVRFSDQELLDGLRLATQRLGHTPSKAEYARLSVRLELARMPTVYSRFGGWRHALRAAGFDVPSGTVRARRWSIVSCWRAVVSVRDELGDPPSYRRYEQLAAHRDDLPSASTLRLRLGVWSQIVAALHAYAPAGNGAGGHNDPREVQRDRRDGQPRAPRANRVPPARRAADRPVAQASAPVPDFNRTGHAAAVTLPSLAAARTLQHVASHPGASTTAVRHGTGLGHPTQAWKLLTRLERDGMVHSRPDGRAKTWTLTPHGRAVLKSLPKDLYA